MRKGKHDMKKVSIGITIGLMAITASVTFVVTGNLTLKMFNEKIRSVNEKQEFYSKLSEIDTYIRTHFVSDIDESRLQEGMVSGYIDGLGDIYAEYLSADEYAARLTEESGVTDGLGFNYEKEAGGYIRITEIIPGSSAEEAGLEAGDIVTAVNNTDVIAFSGGYDEAVTLFSCAEGTRVKLYVKRTSETGSVDFINYDVISQRTEKISVTGELTGDAGYIKISGFTEKTESQLLAALDELISSGAGRLIFDVRGTKGGSPEQLEACLDHILGAGDIVTAEYPGGNSEVIVSCTEAEKIRMPMSVIVDNGTEGMAELFAFALRDNAQAHTIGRTTAGRGYLQTPYTCSDGSVLMLSTAVLKTANSGNFDLAGLKPEFDVSPPEEAPDTSQMTEEEKLLADPQLMKALEVTDSLDTDIN